MCDCIVLCAVQEKDSIVKCIQDLKALAAAQQSATTA